MCYVEIFLIVFRIDSFEKLFVVLGLDSVDFVIFDLW